MAQTHFTPDPPRARSPSRRRSPEHPQNPAEPPQRPGSPRLRAPGTPRPARDLSAPGHPRDTESPRSFRPVALDHDPTPNDLHSSCPPWYSPQRTQAKPSEASVNPPLPSATKDPRAGSRSRNPSHPPSPPERKANVEKKANAEHHPLQGATGGSGGSPPRKSTASHWRRGRKAPSIVRRRVATGANHPASRSSAFRRGPGTPAVMLRRGTRASI